jgi:TolB-like protein/predicted Ser/Thr protein kinase/Flp pilus assembly protein TadD
MAPDDDNTKSFVPLTKGTRVSHYKIISKIGAGGMGEVYLAEDSQLDRKVALKFLPSHLCQDEASRARFTREAKAAAKLDHPNIVPVYEVGEFQGRPFFAMAHIEGKSLREVIKEGKLTVSEAIDLTMQICEGLNEAHTAGVVHRDIKPGNIIIDKKSKPRLLDFGLATVSGEEKLTKTGSTLGTVGYMSPEQIDGTKVDHRSDIFSVGVILYEMLTGRRPFEGDNDAAVVKAISSSTPEPIARFKSGVTGELQQIIDKALAKDVSIRYQHADGMLADLKRLQMDKSPIKKRKLGLWIAAAVIVIIGGYFVNTNLVMEKSKPVKGPKKLVVLPFDNLGDEGKEYLATGMTEEIISRLSNISGLAVVSRMSAARLKEAGIDVKGIGQELGVEYVLDGSLRWQETSDGERRLRLITNLIKVADDANIWSKTYDTVLTDVFTVQADIAEQVAEQMDVVLLDTEKEAVWARWSESEEAYDYYLRVWDVRGGQHEKQANLLRINLLHKAIELDTNFALAYATIAEQYGFLYAHRQIFEDSIKQLCRYYAEKAARLSDHRWVKNFPIGRYYAMCEDDHEKALQYYDLAYGGNKNHPRYLHLAHGRLTRMGQWEKAYEYMTRCIELEPAEEWHKWSLGNDCHAMRRYEEAEKLYKEFLRVRPEVYVGNLNLTYVYINWKSDIESAREVIAQTEGLVDAQRWKHRLVDFDVCEGNLNEARKRLSIPYFDSTSYYGYMAWICRVQGDTIMARVYVDSLLPLAEDNVKQNPNDNRARGHLGRIYALLGRRDEALSECREAARIMPVSRDAERGHDPLLSYLDAYTFLEEYDSSIMILDSVLSMPAYFGLGQILIDPDYSDLINHPKFEEIMEKHADTAQWRVYNERFGSR